MASELRNRHCYKICCFRMPKMCMIDYLLVKRMCKYLNSTYFFINFGVDLKTENNLNIL